MLDVRLPDIDGHAVLSAIRRHENTPVIFLTVMAEELDRIVGLKLGGDGYVVKPASPAEIVARMDGVLRRSERAEPPAEYLRLGCLEVDLAAHGARVDGRGLALTPTEFRLLSHLAARPRRVFTRAELMGACLPQSNAFDRVVDSHVSSLRRKLIAEGLGKAISAVRGVGYRLDLEADGS